MANPTLQQTLQQAVEQLIRVLGQDYQSHSKDVYTAAHAEAETLLCDLLTVNRAYLRTWPEKILPAQTYQAFQNLLRRRCRGEPIAYICERRDFWNLQLRVTPATLIPRPETEHLVEATLHVMRPDVPYIIADLGTGSGAVALSLAMERPESTIYATDVSQEALKIAQQNAVDHQLSNVQFFQGNWLLALPRRNLDVIVSNPPYIAEDDPHLLQGDLRFEPPAALSAGKDGLRALRTIIQDSRDYLCPGGWLLLEHGYNQRVDVHRLLCDHGFRDIQCLSDFSELERVSLAQFP